MGREDLPSLQTTVSSDPDLSGLLCFQTPGKGDQTGKDGSCHTLSCPTSKRMGHFIPVSLHGNPVPIYQCSKATGSRSPCQAWRWRKGEVRAESQQAHPRGSNEACEGHRGCLGVMVTGGQGRSRPGVTAAESR